MDEGLLTEERRETVRVTSNPIDAKAFKASGSIEAATRENRVAPPSIESPGRRQEIAIDNKKEMGDRDVNSERLM